MKIYLVACLTLWLLTASGVHAQKPELVVPIGHTDNVNTVAISPNGRYIVSGSNDKTVKLWEVSSGKLIRTFDGHVSNVNSVAFSPDGLYVVSGENFGPIKLWEVNSGKVVRNFNYYHEIFSVAFSPNGRYIVSGAKDNTVQLWEISSGQLVRSFEGHTGNVTAVAFSPDGRYVLSGSIDHTSKLWDPGSGQLVRSFDGHTNYVTSVAFSPGGRYMVSGSGDHTIKLWDVGSGKVVQTFDGDSNPVFSVAFSSDTRYLVTAGDTIKLWDVGTGKVVKSFTGDTTRFYQNTKVNSVVFSSDARYIVSGSADKTVKLWNVGSGKIVRTFDGHTNEVNSVAFSPDGHYMVSASGHKAVQLWEVGSGKVVRNFAHSASEYVRSVAFSPDGHYMVSGSSETLKLWDVGSGKVVRTFEGKAGNVTAVTFSPDGRYVVCGAMYQPPQLWEVNSGKVVRSFEQSEQFVSSIAFSPDGRYIVSGSNKLITLWDAGSGKVVRAFEGETTLVHSVAFSPDGRYVASGSGDNTIKLRKVRSGELVKVIYGGNRSILSIAFSADGRYVVSASTDGTLKRWDINTGKEAQTFKGHTNRVHSVAFSADGHFILSGSEDNTTKLWNTSTGKEIATLISVDSTNWVVTTPAGLFDASPGAFTLMHYVVNDSTDHDEPWTVIDLEQFKQRYYQPGLLPILMGFKNEPLRQVPAFEGVALPPGVQLALQTDTLTISLKNHKGGIGRVAVFFNGAEVVNDLRISPLRDSIRATLSLQLPLARFANRFDTLNQITVLAYNGAGWLSSRPQTVAFRPVAQIRGGKVGQAGRDSVVRDTRLRAVVVGTSNVGLRFAHKDAEQMARSLSLVASSFLGAEKTVVQLFTTQDGTTQKSTKDDIVRALVEAQQTHAQDVFILYLSGHGVNYGGQEGDFYYLTAGATQADAGYLNRPDIRQTYALSSEELTDLLNQIPARKKLLILDVCAAGKGAERLVLAARDIPASQVRAIDKLQGRTGFYVLAGSAADAVSYESNVYGQGLLTYALLQGIRGAALRREGQEYYVDVETLLNHAIETVPTLAKEIKGIQQPFYRTAREQRTFDIGRVTDSIREQIHLAEPKRVLLIRSFQEEAQFYDVLKLKSSIEGTLTDRQARGTDAPFLLMEAEDYPDAYALAGRYKLMGEHVTVACQLFRSGVPVGEFTVRGEKGKLSELAQKIVDTVQERLNP